MRSEDCNASTFTIKVAWTVGLKTSTMIARYASLFTSWVRAIISVFRNIVAKGGSVVIIFMDVSFSTTHNDGWCLVPRMSNRRLIFFPESLLSKYLRCFQQVQRRPQFSFKFFDFRSNDFSGYSVESSVQNLVSYMSASEALERICI